jgi:hypothetical protein
MLAGVAAWLWPFGVGGRMPVGGDVTQFSIGLMGFLSDSLKAGRLPIWNDRWGYGFPGLAESQMGVYYPPHLALYGPLFTELAYTLSLVLHTFLCALGAYWAARQWGTSRIGAALAGFCFTTCGFFVIHLPHQWGYTAAAWMPWAWGLAWRLLTGRGGLRTALVLTAVLAVQVLPGHFQIAFITQATVGVMALVGLIRRENRRWSVAILLALGAVLPLAACQLWPTWELAKLAAQQRDFGYLSGFAVSPFHLVSYVAPRLFHLSPLWRPLAWDMFHTSPEEHLGYIGLAPLWLAFCALWQRRQEPAVRTLGLLILVSVLLSLGPYLPAFRWYYWLPGFSFFRAPARWGVATMLGLSLLAGIGFDALGRGAVENRRISSRGIGLLVAVSLVWALAPIVLVELYQNQGAGRRGAETTLAVLSAWLPFPADSARPTQEEEEPADAIFRALAITNKNPIVQRALLRGGLDPASTFLKRRWSIYRQELLPSAALALALFLVGLLDRYPRCLLAGLLMLTVVDLGTLRDLRGIDDAPIRPLVEQSPVLRDLAESHRETGGRSADPFGNLAMVGGGAPVNAYRTLTLPEDLSKSKFGEPYENITVAGDGRDLFDLMVMHDVVIWVNAPHARYLVKGRSHPGEAKADPALAGWLFGRRWIAGDQASRSEFWVFRKEEGGSRAILLHSGEGLFLYPSCVPYKPETPERVRIEADLTEEDCAKSKLIVTNLYIRGWAGTWESDDGRRVVAEIHQGLSDRDEAGGWQDIVLPGPGRWTLRLRYDDPAVRQGQLVSAVAWLLWLGLWSAPWRGGRANRSGRRALGNPGGTALSAPHTTST